MMTEKFEIKANAYNIVSFDIFDTLVERSVLLPSEIFIKVGKRVFGDKYACEFYKNRIRAEQEARRLSATGEIGLVDIYSVLAKWGYESVNVLKNVEIECEIEACRRKYSGGRMFDWALNSGKRVVLTSDMYLPRSVIEQILLNCNIKGYECLFISSEHGCDKVSGKLFDVVVNDLRVEKGEVLHVGDNFKADVMGAKIAGIASYWIPQDKQIKKLAKKILYKLWM